MRSFKHHRLQKAYIAVSTLAIVCATSFAITYPTADLPGFGRLPLLKLTLIAALVGYPLLVFLRQRGIAPPDVFSISSGQFARLFAMGAGLALPAIAIDLATGFPRNMNVPVPGAFAFYPAAALVAEVLFHLLPLAALTLMMQGKVPMLWLFAPVVFVEPLFQAMYATGPALQMWLVFASVSLISAIQLWVLRRHGFVAMIALRLVFYFFWHILWGTLRLSVPW